MPGFSLSILHVDIRSLELIDAPTSASAWPRSGVVNRNRVLPSLRSAESPPESRTITAAGKQLQKTAQAVANALIAAEAHLTELDSITGDGDLGASMKRGAEAVLALPDAAFADVGSGLMAMGDALRRAIAGSSGPFYATALMRASRQLAGIETPTSVEMAEAFSAAVQAVSDLGGAKPGDRTMIDALRPAADTFIASLTKGQRTRDAWQGAIAAGIAGAEATKAMRPKLGRASYLGDRALGHPDGGAVAVTVWLKAIEAD
jgi:dihydroxyacetone kinase